MAAFRSELLDLAFEAVSKFPLDPHVKNRSRAQEAVVRACFALDQPLTALEFIADIRNWRKGVGYADFAFYCAERGIDADLNPYLALAGRLADDVVLEESDQAWRRDRIRSRIASTYLALGEVEKARELEAGLVSAEAGPVQALKASRVGADDLDAELGMLDRQIASGDFDQVRNAMQALAQLFDRFYGDADRRSQIEERSKSGQAKLPSQLRIELAIELAGFALEHSDPRKALELIEEATFALEGSRWASEDRIAMIAKLSAVRHRAGDKKGARRNVDAALAMYNSERDKIVNIYCSGALRSVAEAYASLGDTAAALALYRRAVEAGVENPNSRPRADDLSATCISLALHGVEPDAELWDRLRQVCEDLGDPW